MKIFVAYGYNDRDRWIREMVFPIIEAFGSEFETGEETFDGSISDSVKNKIRRSDALIGFTTKRISPDDSSEGATHLWVIQELAIAYGEGKSVLEVREKGVNQQIGIIGHYQRIEYDETARDKCLVEIVKAFGVWHRNNFVQVQLLPEGVANNDLRPLLDQGLMCEYIVKTGNFEDAPISTKVEGITGGLFINVRKPDRNAFVKIKLRFGNKVWSSDYESLSSYGIHLR